jgi:competence protein ComEA
MKRLAAIVFASLAPIGAAFAAVNVNTADRDELQTLEGIDAPRAQAIIDYRTQHGPFRSLDDLDKVAGIGKPTLTAIRKEITFTGEDSGLPAMKKDNRAADRADARAQRGYTK